MFLPIRTRMSLYPFILRGMCLSGSDILKYTRSGTGHEAGSDFSLSFVSEVCTAAKYMANAAVHLRVQIRWWRADVLTSVTPLPRFSGQTDCS